jgi:hypothetical protein
MYYHLLLYVKILFALISKVLALAPLVFVLYVAPMEWISWEPSHFSIRTNCFISNYFFHYLPLTSLHDQNDAYLDSVKATAN